MTRKAWLRTKVASRTIATLVIAMLVVGLLPGSASAAPATRRASSYASTFKEACVPQGDQTLCTNTSLNVYTTEEGTTVCVGISTYETDQNGQYVPISSEHGCSPAAEGAFTIDSRRLSSATLSDTLVTLETWSCTPDGCQEVSSRDVTVAATFTGTGPLNTSNGHNKSEWGNCTFFFTGKSAHREGEATFTLDGQIVDPPAFLGTSTSTIKEVCR